MEEKVIFSFSFYSSCYTKYFQPKAYNKITRTNPNEMFPYMFVLEKNKNDFPSFIHMISMMMKKWLSYRKKM